MKVAFNTADQSFNRKLVVILLTIGAIWLVWFLHEVILLVFLSIIIAIAITIPAKKLEQMGVSVGLAKGISVVFFTALFFLAALWLVPLLGRELESLFGQLPSLLESLQQQFAGTGFGDILNSLLESESSAVVNQLSTESNTLVTRFVDNGLPVVFSGAGLLISVVTNLLLVLVVAVMFLINPTSYVQALLYVVPRSAHQPIINIANKVYETLKAWLKALSFSITFTAVAVYLGMVVIGVPNPAAIAIFAALATFIPNIGAIIPIVPIALFTIGSSVELFVIAVAVYLGIQLIESNVVTPAVVKKQLSIPVAAVLITQITAGVLFGLLGILLAVPLLAVSIVVIRELVAKHHYGYDEEIKVVSDELNLLHLE